MKAYEATESPTLPAFSLATSVVDFWESGVRPSDSWEVASFRPASVMMMDVD